LLALVLVNQAQSFRSSPKSGLNLKLASSVHAVTGALEGLLVVGVLVGLLLLVTGAAVGVVLLVGLVTVGSFVEEPVGVFVEEVGGLLTGGLEGAGVPLPPVQNPQSATHFVPILDADTPSFSKQYFF